MWCKRTGECFLFLFILPGIIPFFIEEKLLAFNTESSSFFIVEKVNTATKSLMIFFKNVDFFLN